MGNTCQWIDRDKEKAEVNISSIQVEVENNSPELYNPKTQESRSKGAALNGQLDVQDPQEQAEVNVII